MNSDNDLENKSLQISEYLYSGIENIIKGALKASFQNPRETAFMLKFMLSSKAAKTKRDKFEASGRHIPPFLIASITDNCNLFCKGCYAREFKICGTDETKVKQLTTERWNEIFNEASELGISFILLAGGEPMIRREVIEKAAMFKDIIFPIFTNGTMINAEYLELFNKNRNLLPVLSIEGDEKSTDSRRGEGIYKKLSESMKLLNSKDILFGASITVTTENINSVTDKNFINTLYESGCKVIFFIEYVPVAPKTQYLAPSDIERDFLDTEQNKLRDIFKDIIFISFPGDEKYMGGCLASGRGFFHINSDGSAEPCPFSPYSDTNLKECTLLEALESPLLKNISEFEMLSNNHTGGCLLFEKEGEVKKLVSNIGSGRQ